MPPASTDTRRTSSPVTEAATHTPAQIRALRLLVLAAVFVCAACGLVYELALVALGSYLLGSSITQTAIVISVSMFAMGVGAVAVKPLLNRPLSGFVGVEIALGVVGGFSVPALYASFAWLHAYTPAMVAAAFAIGALVGAEIPLLMGLLQRLRAQDPAHAVADINAVDYVGALVGGLAFPFLLLPFAGLLEGTLLVASLNVAAAWVVAVGFVLSGFGAPDPVSARVGRARRLVAVSAVCVLIGAALGVMAWRASAFEASAQQVLYRDPIVYSARSDYQSLVVTRGAVAGGNFADLRLFLDGDLQFSSVDEYRYHEMLVHPALNGPRERVLVLGGGDGLALREILRTPGVEEVTLVDLDPAVVDLARSYEPIVELNEHSWDDERVSYVPADAFTWVRDQLDADAPNVYDAVIVDFPDPDSTALAKLYATEMYQMVRGLLAPQGRMVVQSGSPFFAPDAFWSIKNTIAASGFATTAYQADVPSFGNWGFVLAAPLDGGSGSDQAPGPQVALADDAPPMRFLTPELLDAAQVFPADRAARPTKVSTLLNPAILEYSTKGWVGY